MRVENSYFCKKNKIETSKNVSFFNKNPAVLQCVLVERISTKLLSLKNVVDFLKYEFLRKVKQSLNHCWQFISLSVWF